MDRIKLSRASNDDVSDFKPNENPCIICNKSDNSVLNTENGREKTRAVGKVRNDIVTNRLQSLSETAVFSYHMSNVCYNSHKKFLLKLQSDKERSQSDDTLNISLNEDEGLRKSPRKRARYNSPEARVTSNLDSLCISVIRNLTNILIKSTESVNTQELRCF